MVYLPGAARGPMVTCCRHAAGTQNAAAACRPVARLIQVLSKCFFQMSSPVSASMRVDVVGNAGLRSRSASGRCFVFTLADDQRLEQRMHLARLLSSLIFQSSFMSLTLAVVRIFSSFCQFVRFVSPPSVSQSAAETAEAHKINGKGASRILRIHYPNPTIYLHPRHPTRIGIDEWFGI